MDSLPKPVPAPRHRLELLVVFALLAAGMAIYGQTLGHAFISLDDPGYVARNPHVLHGLTREGWRWAWASFEMSNWHPLTWLSLMLDAQLYGLNAGGYHLTNLLLHLTNAVLLFWWLRTASAAFWPSTLTALFFMVHPMHVESVAWVTERKDVLSTLFFCLTLLAYTRYTRGGQRSFYVLALLLYALGLAAKPMLVTLPPLLLLLDFWPLRRTAGWRRLALEKLPFFALASASCVMTFAAQHADAVVPLDTLPVPHRLAAAMLGAGFYLQKTLWPVALGVYYPYWREERMIWPIAWGLALAAITAFAASRARRWPWLFVGWCWFVGTLVPVIGVVQVGGQAVADRYMYLPQIGLFIAIFWSAAAAIHQWPSTRPWLAVAAAGAAAICLALAWRQAGYWRDSDTLFEHTATVVRPSGHLYRLLGDARLEANRPDEAEQAYRQAWNAGARDADTVIPWSNLLLKQARWLEVAAVLRPLAVNSRAEAGVLNNFAFALVQVGSRDEAVIVYRRCVSHYPDYARARFGWGDLLLEQGETVGAIKEYEAGLSQQNDWLPALTRLAWLYALSGNEQWCNRAFLLARRAVDLSGGRDLGSLNAMAAADAATGRWDEAIHTAQAACDLAGCTGSPAGAAELCRARLEAYRQRQLTPL